MKKNLSLLLLILFSIYSCAQTNRIDKIEAVDDLFKKWDNLTSPGAAIGIIQNGELVYSKGYGLANLEHNIPNSPQTAFSIASNSKQFTAASIVLLSLKGKLDLNQSLRSFFPEFPEYAKNITIENLLHHTSGLRDYAQITYLSGLRPDDYYNDEDILKWITSQKELNFLPGEKHLYCNSGYWLLGQIVNKVSGMSLADFAQKEIFEPLGMTNTRFLNNNTMIIKQRASGYSPSRSGGFRNISSMLEQTGDRGIYTTVEDIKKWDDEFYERKILNDSFWKLMTTYGVLNNGESIDYAFGLQIKEHKGLKTISHGGRAPGYLSDIIRFPEQNFTIIIFTNTADANATRLSYQIADIFLKDHFKEPSNIKSKRKINVIKLPNNTLKKYEASYWNTKDSYSRKIALRNDTLRYVRSPRSMNSLLPISKNEFKMLNTPPSAEVFVRFQQGNKMIFIENGTEVGTFKTYIPTAYSLDDLQLFLGIYFSEEIEAYYEFKIEKDEILRLYINGRETVPLRPVMDNLFSSPMGIFKFKRNSKDVIESFRVSTPRVIGVTFKKVE